MSSVRVAVRVRPMNRRERKHKAKCIIAMKDNVTQIDYPEEKHHHTFAFDFSHWSFSSEDTHYATQEQVYNDIGKPALDHALEGYNACIFAYGQTGAGKSFTMMGDTAGQELDGIIPRLCRSLFARIRELQTSMTIAVEVSYLEIYNEKVRDLLNPSAAADGTIASLRVREHPVFGPYVEDLSKLAVSSFADIHQLMTDGNKYRHVASTNMNAQSSRSHAVFTINITMQRAVGKVKTEKVAKLSLVDLAGSERVSATKATGSRLREGANINQSLTALGKVISALAERSKAAMAKSSSSQPMPSPSAKKSIRKGRRSKLGSSSSNTYNTGSVKVIPYRESSLTWLLKESLGGNSKTSMVAAISPASINVEETISTLRYADRAKQIICQAIVNEDPNSKMIRMLQDEIEKLKLALSSSSSAPLATGHHHLLGSAPAQLPTDDTHNLASASKDREDEDAKRMAEQLAESEKLIAELTRTWEEKLEKAETVKAMRERMLQNIGVKLSGGVTYGMAGPRDEPHLVNLSEFIEDSELLVYYIHEGLTEVTSNEEDADLNAIVLKSGDVVKHHCLFERTKDTVRFRVMNASAPVRINDEAAADGTILVPGTLIQFGSSHLFRFTHPTLSSQTRATRAHTLRGPSAPASPLARSLSSSNTPLPRDTGFAVSRTPGQSPDVTRVRSISLQMSRRRTTSLMSTGSNSGSGSNPFGLQAGEIESLLAAHDTITIHELKGLLLDRRNIHAFASESETKEFEKSFMGCLQMLDSEGKLLIKVHAEGMLVTLRSPSSVPVSSPASPSFALATPPSQRPQHRQTSAPASSMRARHDVTAFTYTAGSDNVTEPSKASRTHMPSRTSQDLGRSEGSQVDRSFMRKQDAERQPSPDVCHRGTSPLSFDQQTPVKKPPDAKTREAAKPHRHSTEKLAAGRVRRTLPQPPGCLATSTGTSSQGSSVASTPRCAPVLNPDSPGSTPNALAETSGSMASPPPSPPAQDGVVSGLYRYFSESLSSLGSSRPTAPPTTPSSTTAADHGQGPLLEHGSSGRTSPMLSLGAGTPRSRSQQRSVQASRRRSNSVASTSSQQGRYAQLLHAQYPPLHSRRKRHSVADILDPNNLEDDPDLASCVLM